MLYANTGKARVGGRDINVPCNPLPEATRFAGELIGRGGIGVVLLNF